MNAYRIYFKVWDDLGEPCYRNMQIFASDMEDATAIFWSIWQEEDARIITIKHIG